LGSPIAAAVTRVLALLGVLLCTGQSMGQEKLARIGILVTPLAGTDEAMAEYYVPFRRMLARQGWIEGKNVSLEYRMARGTPPQFDEPAKELVKRGVDVIYANSAPASWHQAR